jgi:hypothetical protein
MWKPILLCVALALPIGGFVNYQRNAPLDQELKNRTYASLSDADLAMLVNAHEGQTRAYESRLAEGPQGQEMVDGYAAADLDAKLKGFESFQEFNRQWRDMRGQLLEQKAALEELSREQSIRARGLDREHRRILRRVISF